MIRKINKNKFGVIEYAIDDEKDLQELPREDVDNTVYAILNKNGKRLVYLYSKELKDYILVNGDLEGINIELENINEQLDTINNKLVETIFLSNFKKINGEIDDSERLQRAVNSGNNIFLNEKDITISKKIKINSNTVVYGIPNYTTIKASGTMGEVVMIGNSGSGSWEGDNFTFACENIILKDVIIHGNRDSRGLGNNPFAHTISFAWVKNLTIENVTIKNSNGASILLYNCCNAHVNKNNVYDSGSNGILCMQKCKDIWVTNNNIDTTLGQNAIFFMYQNGLSSVNTYIINNIVKNAYDFGIEVGDHVAESGEKHFNTHILNNKLYNIGNAGISCRTVDNAYILNNIIEGFGKSTGYGTEAIFCEGEAKLCKNLHVNENTIVQTSDNTGSMSGIFITGYKDFIVKNNYLEGCKNQGINIEASTSTVSSADYPDKKRIVTDFKIIGNTILNCTKKGIRISGYNSKNIIITDNNVKNCGLQGIEATGQNKINTFLINNNIINSCGTSGIIVYNTENGTIGDNKLYNNSLTGTDDNGKSNLLITGSTNIIINNIMCLDTQETPTQKYSITIGNSKKIYVHYPNFNVGSINQYSNTDYKLLSYT